jgi:mono/diheme cytochrome c family protein
MAAQARRRATCARDKVRAVLGTWLFVAFWVVLGFAVFFVAVRGGPRGARDTFQSQTHGARRAASITFILLYIGFGIAIPAVFLTGNHANADSTYAGMNLTPAEKRGQMLFGRHCAVCHTLAAANAVGKVGPDLDTLSPAPTQALVLRTIQYGCLQNPGKSQSNESCLSQGTMPAAIVTGVQAREVAQFVAAVAGKA